MAVKLYLRTRTQTIKKQIVQYEIRNKYLGSCSCLEKGPWLRLVTWLPKSWSQQEFTFWEG